MKNRGNMSVESLSWALNVEGVNSAERLVLVGIANHDGDGGAWPSVATLARYACVTERSVRRTLNQIAAKGLVSIGFNEGGTRETRDDRRPNRYTLHKRGDAGVRPSPRGDVGVRHGVTPTSGEPSNNLPCEQEPTREGSQEAPQWFINRGYGARAS